MRDFEFIHAEEDVASILYKVSGLGLIITNSHPTISSEPDVIKDRQIAGISSGVFSMYKPNWVFGEFSFVQIHDGLNEGKYSQSPATNFVSLTLYFGGERMDGSVHRLGGGFLSRGVDWYRPSDHTVHAAPPEVKEVFDTVRKLIDTRKRLRGGVHNYAVLAGAWKKLTDGSAFPPFDYILWPPKEQN